MNYFDLARSLAEEKNDKLWLARSQVNLSRILNRYVLKGDSSSAAQSDFYLGEAVLLFDEVGDTRGLMYAQGVFGELESFQRNFEKALIHYDIAAEKAQANNSHLFQEFYRQKVREMKDKLLDTL